MPVGELLERISSRELTEWFILFKIKATEMELQTKQASGNPMSTMGGGA